MFDHLILSLSARTPWRMPGFRSTESRIVNSPIGTSRRFNSAKVASDTASCAMRSRNPIEFSIGPKLTGGATISSEIATPDILAQHSFNFQLLNCEQNDFPVSSGL